MLHPLAHAIGVRMHAEAGEQAVTRFMNQAGDMLPGIDAFFANGDNMRAMFAGSAFPDWGYGGINPEAAEATHWNPFHTAYVQVLQQRFPPPWNAEAQKQIAFFLGIICHSIADIPWHFSSANDKSFLQSALEQGNSGHGASEFAADVFLFAEDQLTPALPVQLYWPFDTLREAFQTAGVNVTQEQLTAGATREQAYFFSGPMLALARANAEKKNHPWVYAHYRDYYYGGLEHDAAIVSVHFKYYYALLNGWFYYQNTPPCAEYVRRNRDYVPLNAVEDAHIIEALPDHNTGEEPFLELTGDRPGGARRALLRFNIAGVPGETVLRKAALWLYFCERRGNPQAAPKIIEAFAANQPWKEGDGQSDPITGIDGRPASDDAVTWNRADGTAWAAPGCGQTPHDHAEQPLSSATILPADPAGRWVTWDITAAAQEWVRHPRQNHGLLLQETAASLDSPGILQFIASEAFKCQPDGYGGGQRVAWRPTLILIPQTTAQ